jgi:hypothetical protein
MKPDVSKPIQQQILTLMCQKLCISEEEAYNAVKEMYISQEVRDAIVEIKRASYLYTVEAIAEALNVKTAKIEDLMHRSSKGVLGAFPEPKNTTMRKWSKEDTYFLLRHRNGMSTAELAVRLNRSRSAISNKKRWLEKNDIN